MLNHSTSLSNPSSDACFLEEQKHVACFIEAVQDLDIDGAKDALRFSFSGQAWEKKSLIMEILETWLTPFEEQQRQNNNKEDQQAIENEQKVAFVHELLPHCFKHGYNPLLDGALEEVFGYGDILYPLLAKLAVLHDCTDKNGNTIYHFAAHNIFPSPDLFVGGQGVINKPNKLGETVMHCFFDGTFGIYTGMPEWATSLEDTLLSVEDMGGEWDIPSSNGLTAFDMFKECVAKLGPDLRKEIEPFLWRVKARTDKQAICLEIGDKFKGRATTLGKKM